LIGCIHTGEKRQFAQLLLLTLQGVRRVRRVSRREGFRYQWARAESREE
jgi:hypothetical protein